ncbi:MAG: hypothetical protein Q4G69_01505 [Planctomycetia bacterium]|nr:hypothetical protein [Planctomycetia bacterium]
MYTRKNTDISAKLTEKTRANLAHAFNWDTKTSWHFARCAQLAHEKGYSALTAIFSACAFAEQIHAERHAKVSFLLGQKPALTVKQPPEVSLDTMIQIMFDQEKETKDLYSRFIQEANEEDQLMASISFTFAQEADAIHSLCCSEIIEFEHRWMFKEKEYNICGLCGYLSAEKEDLCPVCGASEETFIVY